MPAALISFAAGAMPGAAAAQGADAPMMEAGVETYHPSIFDEFLPQNAFDMVRRLPGFRLDSGDDVRGLSGAQGNLLINGRRPPRNSGSPEDRLRTIRVEDVVLLELIEPGARDVDMQGYGLLLNVVTVVRTTRQINGRMEIEPREDGGEEYQAEFIGTVNAERYRAEGTIDLYDERLVHYERVRGATASEPTARIQSDTWRTVSRHNWQAIGGMELNDANRIVLALSEDRDFNEVRPFEIDLLSNDVIETREEDQKDQEVSLEWISGLRSNLEWTTLMSVSNGEETETESLFEDDVLGVSASIAETGQQALRSTMRWQAAPNWTIEGGVTWAFNFLEGSSSAEIDGVPQDVDGSDARVEETRQAVLGTATWTPNERVSLTFGGRVEGFSLDSSNADGEPLELTDVIPRADLTWGLPYGWVARLSSEREVGQLDLEQFLATTNLDNDLNTAGASTLEPPRDWTHRAFFERRFGDRNLVRLEAELREVDNPISRILDENGDVRPDNIGPETYRRLGGVVEIDLSEWGWEGLFLEAEAFRNWSERIDPLQGFERETSGHRDYELELGFRQELYGGRYILGGEIAQRAPTTHFWLTQIRREVNEIEIRLDGEWRHSDLWRSGFWSRLPQKRRETSYVFEDVRQPGLSPVLVNTRTYRDGGFINLWSEYEVREETFFRLSVRSGRSHEGTTLVENANGDFLDYAEVQNDNVPSLNVRLRFIR